jgi:hypothetical protein
MLPRDRAHAALGFRTPDVPAVELHPSPAGMFEHGEKLRDMMCRHGQDFGDPATFRMARPDASTVDAQGRYRSRFRDAWGTVWDCRVFGITGHPVERPLDDWANWETFRPPPAPVGSGADFDAARAAAATHRERFFLKAGWISLFEVLHAVRRFEDVLMDLACDEARLHRLADVIVEFRLKEIRYYLEQGADAIQFADDFGTQEALLISPQTWRRFFRPRLARLIEPVRAAGAKAMYHSCGMVWDLLADLADVGFETIWPQVGLYDPEAFARRCRQLHLAVAIQPDRSHLMTSGSPEQVRQNVRELARIFRPEAGGCWFYVEIDNGFPFENVRALIEAVADLRKR